MLAFDVFGTVVDWHGTISREIDGRGLGISGSDLALAWRDGYQPAMARVRRGELGWTRLDDLHRMTLDSALRQLGVEHLDEATRNELNLLWHRLDPWPDSVDGLHRLRERFRLVTMSNGNLSLLSDMARHAGLPWDLILSAEVFRHYKPDPQTYLGVAEVFALEPRQVMMVAAHKDDLAAAKACGLQTAFVMRPAEFGPRPPGDQSPDPRFDYHATSFQDLADQLGCCR